MAKIRYICDDNGHEFEGNDFSNDCPTCGSTIRPISSGSGLEFIAKTKEFVTNNKLVVGGISLLLLLLLILGSIDCPSEKLYSITINPNTINPYLEIEITTKDEESKKTIKIEPSKVLSIIEEKVKIAGSDKVYRIKDNNRLYLCADDTIGELYFKFSLTPKMKSEDCSLKKDLIQGFFKLTGISESSYSDCGIQSLKPKPSEIVVNPNGDNCNLIISITKDLKGKTVFVSVDGQDGTYFPNKFKWDRKPLVNTKQNVWVYLEGEDQSLSIYSSTNGVTIHEAGCVPIDKSKIVSQFIFLANEFGKEPENRTSQVAFQKFVEMNFPQTIIYLNNELKDDLSSLQNTMKIMASNDGKTFEISGTPVLSSDNTTITFRFQEIR